MEKRILGIDPGSVITGIGIIAASGNSLRHIFHDRIRMHSDEPLADKLARIYDGVSQIIDQYQPQEAAIEKVFVAKNPHSALLLGQARGVAIAAIARTKLICHEHSPRAIKLSVVGTGSADKDQVEYMVRFLLGYQQPIPVDAADALACAICQAQHRVYAAQA